MWLPVGIQVPDIRVCLFASAWMGWMYMECIMNEKNQSLFVIPIKNLNSKIYRHWN